MGTRKIRPPRTHPTLRVWRATLGLNQAEAARVLELSQTTYSRIERGARAMKGPDAVRVRDTTGVPLEVLIGAV